MVDVMPDTDKPEEKAPKAKVPSNSFVYTSETPRYYVVRGLEVNKGDVVEWPDGAPDLLWDSVN